MCLLLIDTISHRILRYAVSKNDTVCGFWPASYFNIQFRSRHFTAIIDGSGDNLVERRNVLKKMAIVAIDSISIDVTEF